MRSLNGRSHHEQDRGKKITLVGIAMPTDFGRILRFVASLLNGILDNENVHRILSNISRDAQFLGLLQMCFLFLRGQTQRIFVVKLQRRQRCAVVAFLVASPQPTGTSACRGLVLDLAHSCNCRCLGYGRRGDSILSRGLF